MVIAQNLIFFALALFLVVKGATLATEYSAKVARNFQLSKYIVGFIVVAFISILPETLISISSTVKGIPSFGLGTLFGSNVADLTLVFAIIILYANRGIKIESRILKDAKAYPLFLLLPLIFGLDGYYSRLEGAFLIAAGIVFYYIVFKNRTHLSAVTENGKGKYKNLFFLLLAMALLLVGAYYTVTTAAALAYSLSISPILIAMLVVSLGTTMPELFFSLESIKKKDDELAVGDILGTVLADATIVVGALSFISPFYFPTRIVYVTGIFMLIFALILLQFIRSGKVLSKKEGYFLFIFWLAYVAIELVISKFI